MQVITAAGSNVLQMRSPFKVGIFAREGEENRYGETRKGRVRLENKEEEGGEPSVTDQSERRFILYWTYFKF